MKYDAGMTGFHKDIVAAIKSMIHGDSDKVAELAAEGSPVPLKDYLRVRHGKRFHGGNTFDCMSSAFLVKFDDIINNDGDTKLQLSWSQVSTFIRKYPSEFFNNSDDEDSEEISMEDETSSPGIEVLDLDVRTFNALKRAGINTIADIESQEEQLESKIPSKYKIVMDKLSEYKGIPTIGSWVEKDMLGDELTFDEITNMVGELIVMDMSTESHEWYKVEKVEAIIDGSDGKRHLRTYDGSKQRGTVNEIFFDKDCHNPQRAWRLKTNTPVALPSPAQSETAAIDIKAAEQISETFNYAVLSAELGDYLKRKEEQLKNEYMNFTANCGRIFAEAQEKLAKHGFGENNGVFEKWITSMGFAKRTVYRMIQIYEYRSCQIGTNEGQAIFDALPKTLQADISAPSAPPQLVEQVMNGDITTHKEYIALKKQLDEADKKLEDAKFHSKQQSESFDRVSEQSSVNYHKYLDEMHKNQDLMKQIRELESRPVDVMVQTDTDAERKFNETIRKINLDFEKFRDEADKDLADMRNQRNAALDRAEAAEAQLNAPKAESNVKSFVIRMTMDDYDAIVKTLSGNAYLKNIIQKAQVLRV